MDFNAMHYYSIRIPVAFYVTDTGRLAFRQLFASFLTDATRRRSLISHFAWEQLTQLGSA